MSVLMQRRTFVATTALAVASLRYQPAHAQSLPEFSIQEFIQNLGQRRFLDQIYGDMFFLYSWRIRSRPMGYEGEDSWQQAALAFLSSVFNQVANNPAQMVSERTTVFDNYYNDALQAYERNASSFDSFLGEIGIEPSGQAATRLKESARGYLALAAAAPDADVPTAVRSSYFWPFC